MARPYLRSIHNGTAVAATTATGGVPTGAAAGDVLIAAVHIEASASVTLGATPSGWTRIGNGIQNGTTQFLVAYWRQWASGMAAPSFSWTGTTVKAKVQTYCYVAADPLAAIEAFAYGTITNATQDSPSVTVVTRGATRLSIHGNAAPGAYTPHYSMTEIDDANTGGTTAAHFQYMAAEQRGLAEGNTGGRSMTCTSGASCMLSLVIKPVSAERFGLRQQINASTATVNTQAATFGQALVAGSTIIAMVSAENASAVNARVNDVDYGASSVNLTEDQFRVDAGGRHNTIWRYSNNADTTAATVTARRGDATTGDMRVFASEWLGLANEGPDAWGNNSGNSTGPTVTSSAMTAGERLGLGWLVANGTSQPTVEDADYTKRFGSSTNTVGFAASRVFDANAGDTDTWANTIASATDWTKTLAIYKAASAGGVVHEGAVALSASGQATFAGKRIAAGKTGLTGSGVLVNAGKRIAAGKAALAASGTLTTAGSVAAVIQTGAVSLSASGTLTATGRRIRGGKVALTASGAFTAVGRRLAAGKMNIAGTGTLTAAGTKVGTPIMGAVSLSASGTLNATGSIVRSGQLGLQATTTAQLVGRAIRAGQVTLSAQGTLIARPQGPKIQTFYDSADFGYDDVLLPYDGEREAASALTHVTKVAQQIRYNVRAWVKMLPKAIRWRSIERINSQPANIQWAVLERVSDATELQWNVRAWVSTKQDILWVSHASSGPQRVQSVPVPITWRIAGPERPDRLIGVITTSARIAGVVTQTQRLRGVVRRHK